MTVGLRFVLPVQYLQDLAGNSVPNGSLGFFATGTDNELNTYSDAGLTTPNQNPVPAGPGGLLGNGQIFLIPTAQYKVVAYDANGVVLWTEDPVQVSTADQNINDLTGILDPDKGGTGSGNLAGIVIANGPTDPFSTVEEPGGDIVGTTGPQTLDDKTLTNATLTAPAINGGTLDGVDLDAASVVSDVNPIATASVGFRGIPPNIQTAPYQLVATDGGKKVIAGVGCTSVAIPANSVTPMVEDTTIIIINRSGGSIGINITTDTLYWSPSGTTGNRTLANFGIATLTKGESATEWLITGTGIT